MSTQIAALAAVAAGAPARLTVEQALHIVVRVDGERFAFPVSHVEEAIDAPVIKWVPVAPPGMLGQLMHRERMIGAWDASWTFRLANRAIGGAALVLRDGPRRIALVVDDVMDTARIELADVHAVPGGADLDGVLSGVCFTSPGGSSLMNIVQVGALTSFIAARGSVAECEPT